MKTLGRSPKNTAAVAVAAAEVDVGHVENAKSSGNPRGA